MVLAEVCLADFGTRRDFSAYFVSRRVVLAYLGHRRFVQILVCVSQSLFQVILGVLAYFGSRTAFSFKQMLQILD